jgi:inorganic pyrophosphatase
MSLLNVPAGKELPEDIYVVIEIPANADPIKYEIDKDTGALFVDRFMSTAMFYPCNYGYINHTLSLDGDPVDVLVPTPYPLQPGSVIRCRPVGVLKMTDEAGEDAKLVATGNKFHGAKEAGGVTRSEQLFRVGGFTTRTAHLFWYAQFHIQNAVGRGCAAITASGCGSFGGVDNFF